MQCERDMAWIGRCKAAADIDPGGEAYREQVEAWVRAVQA